MSVLNTPPPLRVSAIQSFFFARLLKLTPEQYLSSDQLGMPYWAVRWRRALTSS